MICNPVMHKLHSYSHPRVSKSIKLFKLFFEWTVFSRHSTMFVYSPETLCSVGMEASKHPHMYVHGTHYEYFALLPLHRTPPFQVTGNISDPLPPICCTNLVVFYCTTTPCCMSISIQLHAISLRVFLLPISIRVLLHTKNNKKRGRVAVEC